MDTLTIRSIISRINKLEAEQAENPGDMEIWSDVIFFTSWGRTLPEDSDPETVWDTLPKTHPAWTVCTTVDPLFYAHFSRFFPSDILSLSYSREKIAEAVIIAIESLMDKGYTTQQLNTPDMARRCLNSAVEIIRDSDWTEFDENRHRELPWYKPPEKEKSEPTEDISITTAPKVDAPPTVFISQSLIIDDNGQSAVISGSAVTEPRPAADREFIEAQYIGASGGSFSLLDYQGNRVNIVKGQTYKFHPRFLDNIEFSGSKSQWRII